MVAIVIPLYRNEPTPNDVISIQQCFKMLGDFPIIALKPTSLSLEHYPFDFSSVKSMDDRYFKSISSYNELMMSSCFYEAFLRYPYILIHQTDAFVFNNELAKWCEMDFDYIGAPWLRPKFYPDVIKRIKETMLGHGRRILNTKERATGLPSVKQLENRVGNGGFSLRKTQLFYDLCKKYSDKAKRYLERKGHMFNEDVFWSIEMNRFQKNLNIPSYKVAVFFAIENSPDFALELTGGKLPFGCHAWDKNLAFFKPYLQERGYEI